MAGSLRGFAWRRASRVWAKAEAALRLRSFYPHRPPNDPVLGEHRQKLGKNCLLTPSARCGKVGVQ